MTTLTIPTTDEVVAAALRDACQQLREECTERQLALLDRVLSGAPLDQLSEYQLRMAYVVLRRAATHNRTTPGADQDTQDGAVYTLEIPWDRPPLRRNGSRGNPKARNKLVQAVRHAGWALAREQKIPQYDHILVRLHYAPGRHQPQDPMNLTDTSKALIDGLRDAGVVVDDDSTHVAEFEPEILFPPARGPRCWLTIIAD